MTLQHFVTHHLTKLGRFEQFAKKLGPVNLTLPEWQRKFTMFVKEDKETIDGKEGSGGGR